MKERRRKNAVMGPGDYREFRRFIDLGMTTYGLTKADLCDFAKAKAKPTQALLRAEKDGRGRRLPDPAVVAGYDTPRKRKRFVDNVLSRPTQPDKARVLVEMLMHCKARNRWKAKNLFADDPWFLRYFELRGKRVPFIEPIETPAPVVRCAIVPDDIDALAEDLAGAVRSTLPKGQEKAIAQAIAARLRSREIEMLMNYARWVEQAESMLFVRFQKSAVVTFPEKNLRGHNQFQLTQDDKNNLGLGDEDGAVPTPSQFLRGLSAHFRRPPEQRVPKRVRKALADAEAGGQPGSVDKASA